MSRDTCKNLQDGLKSLILSRFEKLLHESKKVVIYNAKLSLSTSSCRFLVISRHDAHTEALNQNNGNIRAAQKLSRHADPKTLLIYDDNRVDLQGQLTNQLDDLI